LIQNGGTLHQGQLVLDSPPGEFVTMDLVNEFQGPGDAVNLFVAAVSSQARQPSSELLLAETSGLGKMGLGSDHEIWLENRLARIFHENAGFWENLSEATCSIHRKASP
jgi:hypothetical protein